MAPSCSGCCWPGAAALSVVVRFRRSRGVERQQLKWFTYAAALMFVFLLLSDILFPDSGLVAVLYGLVIALVPVAAGIAILRYRLYDIDRLINRTLVYGTLSALLGAVYGGAVLVLGQLFGGVGGNPPSWVVAGATLVVATLFQPARSRTQAVVDRRFNRRRYDAATTVQAFSVRLRDEIDLDTLSAELLAVVDQTMQPTRSGCGFDHRCTAPRVQLAVRHGLLPGHTEDANPHLRRPLQPGCSSVKTPQRRTTRLTAAISLPVLSSEPPAKRPSKGTDPAQLTDWGCLWPIGPGHADSARGRRAVILFGPPDRKAVEAPSAPSLGPQAGILSAGEVLATASGVGRYGAVAAIPWWAASRRHSWSGSGPGRPGVGDAPWSPTPPIEQSG